MRIDLGNIMRCMTRSNDRQSRAERRQAKMLEDANVAWKKWKHCEMCHTLFCVNCAWEDRKPRTPKFQGVVVCFNCDPRYAHEVQGYPYMSTRIRSKVKYRAVMLLVLARILAKRPCERFNGEDCKCLPCTTRKLLERTEL